MYATLIRVGLLVLLALITTGCNTTSAAQSNFSSSESYGYSIYIVAVKHIGLNEHRNKTQLKKIVGVNPARIPWCGYYAGYAVKTAGKTPPKDYPRAVAWERYGKKVSLKNARKGDVVVIKTKRGYHVGIFEKYKGNLVYLVGGNQSNSVKRSGYSKRSIRAIRR